MKYLLPWMLVIALLAPAALAEELRFSLEEGGQQNFFLADERAECHLVVRPDARVVAAFPAENSGLAFWLGEGSRVVAREPVSLPNAGGQTITAVMDSLTSRLVVEDVVLGSIRTIRDRQHAPDGAEKVSQARMRVAGDSRPNWVSKRVTLEPGRLVFEREVFDGGVYRAELAFDASIEPEADNGGWVLTSDAPFAFRFTASVPHPPLGGLPAERLLTPAARALSGERVETSLRNLRFLSRGGKMMAGSWRFLTYFGRDTLLSLALLEPVLTREAFAEGLQSVLDRLSSSGQVAHEEDLGAWAVYRRAVEGEKLSTEPIYDYKMVDDDFILPIVLERGLRANPDFLERRSGNGEPNLHRVLRNWNLVLSKAGGPAGRAAINPDLNVGDWRDSNEGLGWGVYPGNVNVTLVPAALSAISRMSQSIPADELRRASNALGIAGLPARLEQADRLADRWRAARADYLVRLDQDAVRERLAAFVHGPTLADDEREFYLGRPLGEFTVQQFLDGAPALPEGLAFYALSLRPDGSPVEVANSDDAFLLFLGDPGRAEVERTLRLLELEYPLGLSTAVGPVVANPAYSLEHRHHRELGRNAYHGAVVWSWQSAMMTAGLLRQMERFAGDPDLVRRLRQAVVRLGHQEDAAGALATSELWSHRAGPDGWRAVAFGAEASDQTESNAAQLWSTVYPANLLRLRAAGL